MHYSKLCSTYKELESTTKRLAKIEIISELLKSCSEEDLERVMYLLQGRVFSLSDERKIGMSSQLIIKAIAKSTGNSNEKILSLLRKTGDLGKAAESLSHQKRQKTLAFQDLSVKKVFENIQKLAELTGAGTVGRKVDLIAELLSNASPIGTRYIVGTVLDKLRIGVAEGVVREAIAKAYDADVKDVERAYDLVVDYVEVAKKAKTKSLKKIIMGVGKPLKVMLAIRVETLADAFKALGKPAQFEYKLDGFRVQIHRDKDNISLFTRRMENVTNAFKELIPVIKEYIKSTSYIIDTELVGYDKKTEINLPFQKISQRIKRKHNIEKMAKDFPVEINAFDILYYEGKNLQDVSLKKRRAILEKIVKQKSKKIVLVKKIITSSEKEATSFYKKALEGGNEGVMIKKVEGDYVPGRRVGGWIKFKPIMETLDLVITGAQWGEGKRANWLASFTLSCRDKGKFLTIGKVGTGIKEKSEGVTFKQLTKELKPYILKTSGQNVEVKPRLVVEVAYEEIQKSPTYSSGLALRFPRVIRIREDRSANDAETLQRIEKFYNEQKKIN